MRGAFFILGLLGALAAPARAATLMVRPDGIGPYPTIQSAVTSAAPGDVVLLTDGIFTGSGNRDILVTEKAIVVASQSGVADACVIDCEGGLATPHRAFIFGWLGRTGAQLRDFTITGGTSPEGGACVLSGAAAPQFFGVVFLGNTATDGGAIACSGSAAPVFTSCLFIGNAATSHGGAVRAIDDAAPEFVNCLFQGNSAGFSGGALRGADRVSARVSGCTFSANTAGMNGGGLTLASSGILRLASCTLYANSALFGAGVACYGATQATLEATLIALSPTGNAVDYGEGGTATLACCDLYGNAGGDWVDEIADQLGQRRNVSLNPQFCSADPDLNRNWTVERDSPCLPDSSGCEVPIGAWDRGCEDTPAERTSWGSLKALYR